MNKLNYFHRVLLLFAAVMLIGPVAKAQNTCKVELLPGYKTEGCAPYVVAFRAVNSTTGKTPVKWQWDFGDGNFNNSPLTDSTVQHQYLQPSADTNVNYRATVTISYSDGSQCQATSPKIRVWDHPTAVIKLPGKTTQCYLGNSFCFDETSLMGMHKFPIVKWVWDFGDGEIDSVNRKPCHSYDQPGTYTVKLSVYDAKGCMDIQEIQAAIVVLPEIVISFNINAPIKCDSTIATFENTTNTTGLNIKSITYDFGDGTPPLVLTDPTIWLKPVLHTYYYNHKDTNGVFTPKVTLETVEGCKGELEKPNSVVVHYVKLEIKYNDYPCWSDARDKGVQFDFPGVANMGFDFYYWTFGDPNSGPLNTVVNSPSPGHKFVGGPKNYTIRFVGAHKYCGNIDTCFILHVNGPKARINITVPEGAPVAYNNYKEPELIADKKAVFDAIDNGTCKPLKYIFYSNPVLKSRWEYTYCNATITKKIDTTTLCSPAPPQKVFDDNKKSVIVLPTDSTEILYYEYTVNTRTYNKGGIRPNDTLKIYYPESGTKFTQNMDEWNVYSCEFPNKVRFVNNSIKFRASNNTGLGKIDRNGPLGFTLGAKDFVGTKYSFTSYDDQWPNPNPDKCLDPNWPYASDSLLYFWSFQDASSVAKPCTSTVNGINWGTLQPQPGVLPEDCNFSTIAAPIHFYRDLQLKDPERPCYIAQLTTVDPVTGCEDQSTIQIRMGKPDAHWDRTAYCEMSWYIQQTFNNPKPRRGFRLSQQSLPCANPAYKFKIDLSETLPAICAAPQNYWITFDSAWYRSQNTILCQYTDQNNNPHVQYEYGFTANDNWRGGDAAQWGNPKWKGQFWYDDTTAGCKTVGVVIQNGNCYDTAWYHNYICFNKLVPQIVMLDSANGFVLPQEIWHQGAPTYNGFKRVNRGLTGPDSTSGYPANKKIKIAVKDPTQDLVTMFRYTLSRYLLPSGDYYYTKTPGYGDKTEVGFWPGEASLSKNPGEVEKSDSITSVKYVAHLVMDTLPTGGTNLYVLKFNPFTFGYDEIPIKGAGYDFFILDQELADLNSTGKTVIPRNDQRANRVGFECGTNAGITIYAKQQPVAIKRTSYVYDLNHKERDNRFRGPHLLPEHDTVVFDLPYPGVYSIQVEAQNMDGCGVISAEPYKVINAHYAKFTASDSVRCSGAEIKFYDKVRYFSTDCPTIFPNPRPEEACLYGLLDPTGSFTFELTPWDSMGPVQARKDLAPDWPVPPRLEQPIEWDFGDSSGVYYGHNPSHIYTKPGVFTVTMTTTDSNGITLKTIRRNFIKIINVESDLALKNPNDSLSVCAPKVVTFLDSSDISKGENTVFVGRKYFAFKERIKSQCFDPVSGKFVPCIKDTTIIYDSIQRTTWTWGDNSNPIARLGSPDSVFHTYNRNDTFDISVKTETLLGLLSQEGCIDSITKERFLIIKGPQPRFSIVSPTKGCLPLTIRVRNENLKGFNYVWEKGDSTVGNSTRNDEFVNLTYDHMFAADFAAGKDSSRFLLRVRQTDSVYDPYNNKMIQCNILWPDTTIEKDKIFWITVYRTDGLVPKGDTILCPAQIGNFEVNPKHSSTKSSLFTSYDWNFGDGTEIKGTNQSKLTHVFTDTGTYYVKVTGTTKYGCPVVADSMKVIVQGVTAEFDFDSTAGRLGNFCFINKSKGGARYEWNFGDNKTENTTNAGTICHDYEPVISPLDKDTIFKFNVCLKVYSPAACVIDTCREVVFVRNFETYNVITPNGDGMNDKYDPKVKGDKNYDLVIFNRWGEKVFESTSPDSDWDGTNFNDGTKVPAGTYYYIINYHFVGQKENNRGNDKGKPRTGTITVIR